MKFSLAMAKSNQAVFSLSLKFPPQFVPYVLTERSRDFRAQEKEAATQKSFLMKSNGFLASIENEAS